MDRRIMRCARERGFNLLETAIVLAVVGLLVGGTWEAAAAVAFHMNIEETKTAVLEAARKLKEHYPQNIAFNIPTTITLTAYEAHQLNLFPEHWYTPYPGNHEYDAMKHPLDESGCSNGYNSNVGFGSGQRSSNPTDGVVQLTGLNVSYMPKRACVRLMPYFSQHIPGVFEKISFGTGEYTGPISMEDAEAYCGSGWTSVTLWVRLS